MLRWIIVLSGLINKSVPFCPGNPAREVDIETASGTIVQVKKLSSANKLIKQIHDTEAATGQRTVGFVIEQHKKANKVVNQASKHVEATNNLDALIEMLK